MKKYRSLRMGKASFLIDRKSLFILVLLTGLTFSLIVLSLGIGQLAINPIDVVKAIFGAGTDMHNLVVQSFRMPRILLAVFAGAGLAMSGAILQGIIRNPLASPDIIGITAGASFTTVAFLAFYSDRSNTLQSASTGCRSLHSSEQWAWVFSSMCCRRNTDRSHRSGSS
jgi:iron complex transport system permease protein